MAKKRVLTTFVNDHSGSIRSNLAEAQLAYDTYITDRQAQKDTKEFLSLLEFDTTFDVVFDYTPVNKVPVGEAEGAYKIRPRGWTALNDAIVHAILQIEARPEAKDDNVTKIVVINTDGLENSSREHPGETGKRRVKELITEKQDKGWVVVYLGATLESVQAAIRDYGTSGNTTMLSDPGFASVGTGSTSAMVTRGLNTGRFAYNAAERTASAGGGTAWVPATSSSVTLKKWRPENTTGTATSSTTIKMLDWDDE